MRYRILASFQGAPYEAGVGPTESDVVLFAACPPPEALKFEPATGHWRKRVSRGDVQTLYESRPVGMFRGERCIVLDELNDRLHIVYLGHDALRAAQLGYWEVDRGVFELITPRQEVTDIVEQRRPLPTRSESGQHSRPGPMPAGRPDDHGAGSGNGVPYSGSDPQLYGYAGHDEFATGPQLFDQRASFGGLPPSISQDLPIAGLSRSEPNVARPADQSEVAIPPVPEPPLPLEAEALRAASSATRRGQKGSQARQPQDARAARRPQPPVGPQISAAPVSPPPPGAPPQVRAEPSPQVSVEPPPPQVQVEPKPAEQAAPSPKASSGAVVAPAQAAEVSQPSAAPVPAAAAPVPAAATLAKAAMLSHAAATAARMAAASSPVPSAASSAAPGKPSDPAASPAARSGEPSQAGAPRADVATEAGLSPAELTSPERVPAERARAERAPAEAVQPPVPEPAAPAPESADVPAMAKAAPPTAKAAAVAPRVEQPTTEPVTASEPVPGSEPDEAQAYGPAGPGQHALSDPPAPAPSVPDQPTSPEVSAPAPVAGTQISPDDADRSAGSPLAGISDPPGVTHPPAGSAVPSWTPQGPVQPQPGFDVTQPAHDVAASHAGYYAPYVASEPMPQNGAANGTAAPFDFGLAAPMPTQQPGFAPPSTFPAGPGPLHPADERSEPADQADADPGTTTRRRRSTKRRLPTQKIFSDLATQAAIPGAAYAIGEDVDGAMCLVRTDEGFEVFNSAAGARHEVRVFQDEESAYFYLFGVLVAESVRTGALVPRD